MLFILLVKKNKFFASFSVEKVTQIQQRWKRRQKKESLEDVDQEIEEFFDLYSMRACKRRTNSNVELFDIEHKPSSKTSPKPSVPFEWSNKIDIEKSCLLS